MIYSTPEFIFLLTVTWILFFSVAALERSYTFRIWILSIASLVYFVWSGFLDVLLFLVVVSASWLSIYLSSKFPRYRKSLLFGAIALMAGNLLFWKYAGWLTRNIQIYYPSFLGGRSISLPLPLGISFFTLQGIAFLVDFYRGCAQYVPPSRWLLFKSFFPQLLAGPIVRAKQLLPQLQEFPRPSAHHIYSGLFLFSLGFFKKVYIADALARYADPVFAMPQRMSREWLVLGVLAYSGQIWADFSGYTDMGRGAAKLFGISLPENFRSPYLARSPSEFWRRWHITLSEWIRDYIYIPLGGNRGGRLRVLGVVAITMLISGLWHGAGIMFVIWGLYHGTLLVLERLLAGSPIDNTFRKLCPVRMQDVLLGATMFVCVAFGWLLFRIQYASTLRHYLKTLYSPTVFHVVDMPPAEGLAVRLALCLVIQVIFYYDLKTHRRPFLDSISTRLQIESRGGAVVAGASLALFLLVTLGSRVQQQATAFIYFRF